MIDEKKLTELRCCFQACERDENWCEDLERNAHQIFDTLEALWKVARAAEKVVLRNEDGFQAEANRQLLEALAALKVEEGK